MKNILDSATQQKQRHTLLQPFNSKVLHNERWEGKETFYEGHWTLTYICYLFLTLETMKLTEDFQIDGMIIASLYLENPDIVEEAEETSWDKGEHVLSGFWLHTLGIFLFICVTFFVSTLSIRSDVFAYTFEK